ncbi:hypothetical protein ACFVZR_33905 [Streptomyces sp. NPDC058316]|uniref:hypothetical protein n=1 Tax=unclassified Streptomyces TaxID=2593676 RepID=UPI003319F17B
MRETGYPPMTVYPAGTPDDQLPPGDVLDKPASRLVFQWPGRLHVQMPADLAVAPSRKDILCPPLP